MSGFPDNFGSEWMHISSRADCQTFLTICLYGFPDLALRGLPPEFHSIDIRPSSKPFINYETSQTKKTPLRGLPLPGRHHHVHNATHLHRHPRTL
jgi:hypothetical protein